MTTDDLEDAMAFLAPHTSQAVGGQAFPSVIYNGDGSSIFTVGMTLRDYFAAAALTGLVAGDDRTFRESARAAYIVADAMLAERAKAVP